MGNADFDYWVHSPFHPGDKVPVTFAVKAKESKGIQKVELYLYEFELYRNENDLPSKRKRNGGQWGLVKTWEPRALPDSVELNYTWNRGFAAASNVEYLFKITDGVGAVSERLAIFDAGRSPWPQDKILLYAASQRPLMNSINLCFFPDVDYDRNFPAFLSDIRKLVLEGYHVNNAIIDHKDDWSFFYTQDEANGLSIALDFGNPDHYPAFMKDSIISGIDAFGLIHKNEYSDGSYLYGNIHFLAQSVFTSEGKNPGTAVHETGHAVFLLSDEYDGCACFQPEGAFANVFATKADCEKFKRNHGMKSDCRELLSYDNESWYTPEESPYFATLSACEKYNRENGYPDGQCVKFIETNGSSTFRSEHGVCIMNDDGDAKIYKFQSTCQAVINQHYDVIKPKRIASNHQAVAANENIFGYEPIALLELKMDQDQMNVRVQSIQYGVPQKRQKYGRDVQLTLLEKGDKVNSKINVNRPDMLEFCEGTYGGQLKEGGIGACFIEVPFSENLTGVKLDALTTVNGKIQIKKTEATRKVDLKEQFENAFKQFKKKVKVKTSWDWNE